MRRTNAQRLASSDRLTLLYSCSVGGSVYGIFGALLNGASLFPRDLREDGLATLAQWLLEEKITVYHSVASVFRQFAAGNAKDGSRFPEIRLVIFGGERVLTSDVLLVRQNLSPECVLFTGLGSTETGTVRKMIVAPETKLSGKVVPLGYPIDGMEVLLLDESGREVGFNQIGEIAVRPANARARGGEGRSDGFLIGRALVLLAEIAGQAARSGSQLASSSINSSRVALPARTASCGSRPVASTTVMASTGDRPRAATSQAAST